MRLQCLSVLLSVLLPTLLTSGSTSSFPLRTQGSHLIAHRSAALAAGSLAQTGLARAAAALPGTGLPLSPAFLPVVLSLRLYLRLCGLRLYQQLCDQQLSALFLRKKFHTR